MESTRNAKNVNEKESTMKVEVGTTVWHGKFGKGEIIDLVSDKITVQFQKAGVKKFYNTAWGRHIFLLEEELENIENKDLIEEYRALNYVPEKPMLKKVDIEDELAEKGEASEVPTKEQLEGKFFIKPFEGSIVKKIVIISCEEKKIGKRKFVSVVGMDITEGKVVSIVDTNGKEYGLHSGNQTALLFRPNHVIEASFKYFKCPKVINTIRVVSDVKVMGRFRWSEVFASREMQAKLLTSFDEVKFLYTVYSNMKIYSIVNFTGTEVKKVTARNGEKKYQIKLQEFFLDCVDPNVNIQRNEGKYFWGWALVNQEVIPERLPRIKVCKFIGRDFLTSKEVALRKSGISYKTPGNYALVDKAWKEIEEKEYELYLEYYENGGDIEEESWERCSECDELFADYEGDVMEEYFEYDEELDEGRLL